MTPENQATRRPLIDSLLAAPLSGPEIEARSLAAIDAEAPPRGQFSRGEWEVVRRMIHATADFSLADLVRFSPEAIESATKALRAGRPIFADSNMIRSGISLARLRDASPTYSANSIACLVADPEVAEQARQSGLPRSLFAARRAKSILDGGIAVFGNAPVALMELSRMIIEEGVRPALVIAMPVGFVHVVESKEELMGLAGVPFVAVAGRRGGSPLAVAALHALCAVATKRTESVK